MDPFNDTGNNEDCLMDLLLDDDFLWFPLYTSDLGDVGMFPNQTQSNVFNPVPNDLTGSLVIRPQATLSCHLHSPLSLQSLPLCDKPSLMNAALPNLTSDMTYDIPLSLADGCNNASSSQMTAQTSISSPCPSGASHTKSISPSASALPTLSPTVQMSLSQSITQALPVEHCSGRAAVPLKHLKAMQEIGSNISKGLPPTQQLSEKENFNLQEPPKWVRLAREYLLTCDLGSEWLECINTWLQLEAQLGYGTITGMKVCWKN